MLASFNGLIVIGVFPIFIPRINIEMVKIMNVIIGKLYAFLGIVN